MPDEMDALSARKDERTDLPEPRRDKQAWADPTKLVHLTWNAMNPKAFSAFSLQPLLISFVSEYPLTRSRFAWRYSVYSRGSLFQPSNGGTDFFLVILRC